MNLDRRDFIKLSALLVAGTGCAPIAQAIQGWNRILNNAQNAACGNTINTPIMCNRGIPASPGQIVAPQLRQPISILNPNALRVSQYAIEAAQQAGLIAKASSMKEFVFRDSQNQALKGFPDQIRIDGDEDDKVRFIVDAAKTATKSGSPTVIDVGAASSTYAAGYKYMNPNSTVFAIEMDQGRMFHTTDNLSLSDQFVFYVQLHSDALRDKVQFDRVLIHNPVSEYKAITDSYNLVKPGGEMIIVPYKPTEGDIPKQIWLVQEKIPELRNKIRVIEMPNTELLKLTGKGVLGQFAQQNGITLNKFLGESDFSDDLTPNGTSKIIIMSK